MVAGNIMRNDELAAIFFRMAFLEEIREEGFKARAYERASRTIGSLERGVDLIYLEGGLGALISLPTIGKAIAFKIEEFIKTGRIVAYDKLRGEIQVEVDELSAVEGIGPRTVRELYYKLGIKSLEDLDEAIRKGSVRRIQGMGAKKESRILRSIIHLKEGRGRFPLGSVLATLKVIQERLESQEGVTKVIMAGSARRMKETIADAEFVVEAKEQSAASIIDNFIRMPEVDEVDESEPSKSRLRLRIGLNANLRIVSRDDFGAALLHFTGNVDYNISMRRLASIQGKELNEYGLFSKEGKKVAGEDEAKIYSGLGLEWIPPELRESQGEIDRAINGTLPDLIPYGSLMGDLQIQTNWTDGMHSILEMAEAAKLRELTYIAITDHTQSLAMTGGLDEDKLKEQKSEINEGNEIIEDFRILFGAEVNILKDGSLDIADYALRELEVVGAAIHSHFSLTNLEQTNRIIRALENENIDILFHPTGRLLKRRQAYEVDMERIMQRASDTGTVLEINSFPNRLDLRDVHIRRAIEYHVKLVIDSDAHAVSHLDNLALGVGQARRGWATQGDVINTLPVEEFLRELK